MMLEVVIWIKGDVRRKVFLRKLCSFTCLVGGIRSHVKTVTGCPKLLKVFFYLYAESEGMVWRRFVKNVPPAKE